MPTYTIPFRETNYFSSLICDYLDEREELKNLYNRFPSIENFNAQIQEKQQSFPDKNRAVLVDSLKKQYSGIQIYEETINNIESLKASNTFTITTGHQLNLFTGPLYFLYKIISTINLTKELKQKHPECNFVPVYWMASEDHDFDEINYFNFKGKKIQWNRESSGGVGRLATDGLDQVFDVYANQLGQGKNATFLKELFRKGYLEHDNLADATRYIANELFKDLGLVIVDADDKEFKRLFIPYVERELKEQVSYANVNESITTLNKLGFKAQVNPREINLFYLKDGLRERIIESNGNYEVNNTDISWSQDEILNHLNESPDCFSPNVIMRPLYQEVILPNLCYIGGGGELAYWLELKSYFDVVNVTFPMLLLRNSVLVATERQFQKLSKLEVSINELFKNQQDLINDQTKRLSSVNIDFSDQKEHLKKQFEALYKLAEQTDKSFLGAVAAQEKKQTKGLDKLEKRLLKAQKRKLSDQLSRISAIQDELFPRQSLQERNLNFSELYLEFGDQLIQQLVLNLQPLNGEFLILEL
ncbi:bacillithiol biosynthesis cysteine-adding enzyme BshC [Flavobacteriaceae sp. LMIT009]